VCARSAVMRGASRHVATGELSVSVGIVAVLGRCICMRFAESASGVDFTSH
jgi:hypothetical protein